MFDGFMAWLGDLMSSDVVYPILFLISMVDAVVPVFPSEAPLIMAGVYAASEGHPNVFLVLLSAGLGALIGDHLNYYIGRSVAGRIDRLPPGGRRAKAVATAKRLLETRGGMALVIARFIPWGRIATTLVFGAMRYPRARFTLFDSLGVTAWALHGTLMGYIGGATFAHDPVMGLVFGLGLAVAVSVVIEIVRWWIHRRRARAQTAAAEGRAEPARASADAEVA